MKMDFAGIGSSLAVESGDVAKKSNTSKSSANNNFGLDG